ncbi:hypothetical protein [Embleya sp. NPDC020630]|uniref:hypothetical protein n=1 Tax=Embleya sp. NPDC020630 TaxID=3363979 RepID=UPI0037AE55BD
MTEKYQRKELTSGKPSNPKLLPAVRQNPGHPFQRFGFEPPKPLYTAPKSASGDRVRFGYQPDGAGPAQPAPALSAEAPLGFVGGKGMADNRPRANTAPTRVKAGFEAPAPTGSTPRSPDGSSRPSLGFLPAKKARGGERTTQKFGFQGRPEPTAAATRGQNADRDRRFGFVPPGAPGAPSAPGAKARRGPER